jgi:chromosomal replication initiation ATPase DnaA
MADKEKIKRLIIKELPRLVHLASNKLSYDNLLDSLGDEIYSVTVSKKSIKTYSHDDILIAVEKATGGSVFEKLKSRKEHFLTRRQLYAFLCKKHTKLSYSTLGEKLQKDHTSVMNNVNIFKDLLDTQDEIACSYYKKAIRHLNRLK